MNKIIAAALLTLLTLAGAGAARAQDCSEWSFEYDGGVDANLPEARSSCNAQSSVALVCNGSALILNFRPDRNLDANERFSESYYQIEYQIEGFTYSDYARFNEEAEEYSVFRHAWDFQHPLFEALVSGSQVEVSLPTRGVNTTISLAGSTAAIFQVTENCMEH